MSNIVEEAQKLTVLIALAGLLASLPVAADPQVRIRTDFGDFFIDLTPDAAPNTVENFLDYVDSGAYDESFFHRNPRNPLAPEDDFVLQGGEARWAAGAGNFTRIAENPPVANEFNVSNARGTVAMAKLGGNPNSATNNWFVNLDDNGGVAPDGLDFQNEGFTVFGTIDASGMAVVDTISDLRTASVAGFVDIPIADPNATIFNRDAVVLIIEARQFVTVSAPAAAILPASRSVGVGATATGFATLVNSADSVAASCRMQPNTTVAADFVYRQTDSNTNEAFGADNPLLDIPAGGSVSLVFSLTPTAPRSNGAIAFDFQCRNATANAPTTPGVNTFELAASTIPGADVVALAATTDSNGINDVPNSIGSGAFAVATVNVGAEEVITVMADTGGVVLPLGLFVCPTDATTGACTEPAATMASTTMGAGDTGTFAVFAQLVMASDTVPFDPAGNRAFVRFTNAAGDLRGSTSVALRTVP